MSNLVKTILIIAFAIFVIGFVWAIVVAVKRPNEVVKKVEEKKDKVEQVATSTPIPTPEPAPVVAPAPQDNRGKVSQPVRRQVTTRRPAASSQEVYADSGSDAWAFAGVDANGNAYAEAYAY